uniref:25S rRNA (uridine-N(3))-methyltransferase BMT5-like domain-containing protein n=2 Tax=Talaromyces marneffei TaxID=37727 RepID=A0A093V126_TALMA
MAKSKNKHSKGQQASGEAKKRKMQNFQRVSISSHPGTSSRANDPSGKKRKLADTTTESPQQAWKNKKSAKNTHQQELHQRPVIPYHKKDRILLIGEGDFSFARSLYEHHRCKDVFATCYDSEEVLLSKYHGHAEENINRFLDTHEDDQENEADVNENEDEDDESQEKRSQTKPSTRRVLYSVDARKLGSNTGGGKDIRKGIPLKRRKSQPYHRNRQLEQNHVDDGGPWDVISFNFPHVGGLSTDVNRQVRANQELLVAFFKACVPLLSKMPRKEDDHNNTDDDYDYYSEDETSESESEEEDDDENQDKIRTIPRQSGQIIVTLFEGEPYTLWNIKDLARHAGLVVVTSFRFPWKSYPGYSHARTLGIVESRGGKGGDEETETKRGGWKGEDREARSYVFEVKGQASGLQRRQGQKGQQGQQKKNQDGGKANKKRGRGDDSSDED